jgi:hypothetical protein
MEVKVLAITFALSFLTETLTEYLFGTPMDRSEQLKPYKWTLMYVSALIGVVLALFYHLDLIVIIASFSDALGLSAPVLSDPTVPGSILSGLLIGRGANAVHDFLSKYLIKK